MPTIGDRQRPLAGDNTLERGIGITRQSSWAKVQPGAFGRGPQTGGDDAGASVCKICVPREMAHVFLGDRRFCPLQVVAIDRRHFGLTQEKYQTGESEITGRISKIGDRGVRVALFEAAHVILTRPVKGSELKSWAMGAAKRAGMKKPRSRWRASLPWCCTPCWRMEPLSSPPEQLAVWRRPDNREGKGCRQRRGTYGPCASSVRPALLGNAADRALLPDMETVRQVATGMESNKFAQVLAQLRDEGVTPLPPMTAA